MKIVIAEDHVMFREVVKIMCDREFGHEVVGEAADGPTALRVTLSTQPDVLLLDLNIPLLDGFGVFETLRQACSSVRVIALTAACGPYTLFRVERAGFHGFVDKNSAGLDCLKAAIEAVGTGKRYFSQSFVDTVAARRDDPDSFDKVLSDREREVLRLIGGSLSDEEIAAAMSINPKTAETYRQRVMNKLRIHSTPKLIRFAIENGFTQVPIRGG